MREKGRWTKMKERAFDFVDRVSVESRILLWVFDDSGNRANQKRTNYSIDSKRDRTKVKNRIESFGSPGGGTALYDTLWHAFEEAERLSKASPGRYISVMVYTDGKDENSTRTREQLLSRFDKLVANNRNLWCFITPLGTSFKPLPEGGHIRYSEPKIPVPVRLSPTAFTLPSPASTSRMTLNLDLKGFDKAASLLRGKKVTFTFEAAGGSPLKLRLNPASIDLSSSKVTLQIEVLDSDQLEASREYQGTILVSYPDLDEHVIQGPTVIDLQFQKEERPKISDLRPLEGAVFATNAPVIFLLSTLQGAQVLWDFGDGASERGTRVTHAYTDAGPKRVVATVTGPNGLKATASTQIELVSAAVVVDQPGSRIFAGVETQLHASQRGGVTQFEWVVDGRVLLGGGASGEELTVTFTDEGQVPVMVRGIHPKLNVDSEEIMVDVLAAPALVILEPDSGSTHQFGVEVVFTASLEGPATEVVWQFVDEDTGVEFFSSDVLAAGTPAIARLRHVFPEGSTPSNVLVKATAPILGLAAPLSVTSRIQLVAPVRGMDVVSPARGTVLPFGEPVVFGATLTGPGASGVQWRLVDQTTGKVLAEATSPLDAQGGSILRHTFDAPEDLLVRVTAEATTEPGSTARFPRAQADYSVQYPAVEAQIQITSSGGFSTPVRFVLVSDAAPESVNWEFGDGARDDSGNSSPSHTYNAHGTFTVTAQVVAAGGKQARPMIVVEIPLVSPVAAIGIASNGESTSRVGPGETVEFTDESVGDVVSRTWVVDGAVSDQTGPKLALVFDEEGVHHVELRVEGPPGEGGVAAAVSEARADVPVKRSDHVLFTVGALVILLFTGFLWKFFSGNDVRAWKIGLSTTEDMEISYRSLTRFWSRLRKEARVPIKKLPCDEYWRGKTDEFLVRMTKDGPGSNKPRLKFTGAGQSNSHAVRLESDPLKEETGKSFWTLVDETEGATSPVWIGVETRIYNGGFDLTLRIFIVLAAGASLYALSNYAYGGL